MPISEALGITRADRQRDQRAQIRRRAAAVVVGLAVLLALSVSLAPGRADASERDGRRVERQHGNGHAKPCRCKPKVHKQNKHRKEQADHGKRGQWKKHKRGSRWHQRHKRDREARDGGGRKVEKRPVVRCKTRVCGKVFKPGKHVAPPVRRHRPKPIRWHRKPKPRVIVDKPGFRDQPPTHQGRPPARPASPKAPTVILSPPVSKTAPKPAPKVTQPQHPELAGALPFTGGSRLLLPVGLGLVLLGALGLLAGSYKHNDRPVR